MLSLKQISGVRVYATKPAPKFGRKTEAKEGTKRLGKVHNAVFSPDGTTVVGLMVKRPDVAGMVKREDVFLALDSVGVIDEGLLVTNEESGMDERARRRLGLDWDECIIWAGMDVRKESGSVLGYVDDVVFSPRTGRVKSVSVSEGGMANAMVGTISIESGQIVGYRDGHMVVSDDVDERALSGGFAARAGEATARAKIAAGEASAKASKVVGDAVDVGSHKLGRALGKAKRAVVEATQEEPEPAEVEAEQVAVESVPAKATRPPEKPSTKKPSAKKAAGKAAKAAARQLGKTRGMFGAFIDEFEKSSK